MLKPGDELWKYEAELGAKPKLVGVYKVEIANDFNVKVSNMAPGKENEITYINPNPVGIVNTTSYEVRCVWLDVDDEELANELIKSSLRFHRARHMSQVLKLDAWLQALED